MATNSSQKQPPIKNEYWHPGKKAAKGNRLFRKAAPLVGAALFAGCAGAAPKCQKGQECRIDNIIIAAETPETWSQDIEPKKEGANPQEQATPQETAQNAQSTTGNSKLPELLRGETQEDAELFMPFFEQLSKGGLEWLNSRIANTALSRPELGNSVHSIGTRGTLSLVKADYSEGTITLNFHPTGEPFVYEVATPRIEEKGSVQTRQAFKEDASGNVVWPLKPDGIKTELNVQTSYSGQRILLRVMPATIRVKASSSTESHLLDFNIGGTPNMGKVISLYDKEMAHFLVITDNANVALPVVSFDITPFFFRTEKNLIASYWATDDNRRGYVFILPENPSSNEFMSVVEFHYVPGREGHGGHYDCGRRMFSYPIHKFLE